MPATKPPFRFWSFFFSLKGRVSRLAMWTCVLPGCLAFVGLRALGQKMAQDAVNSGKLDPSNFVREPFFILQMVLGAAALVLFWPAFALTFKRLHDVRRTGLLALVMLLPTAAGAAVTWVLPMPMSRNVVFIPEAIVWLTFLYLGVANGTHGPNRYGPDPLGRETAQDVF